MVQGKAVNQAGFRSEHAAAPSTPTIPDDEHPFVLTPEVFCHGKHLRETLLGSVVRCKLWEIAFLGRQFAECCLLEKITDVHGCRDFFGIGVSKETMIIIFVAEDIRNVQEGVLFVRAGYIGFPVANCDDGAGWCARMDSTGDTMLVGHGLRDRQMREELTGPGVGGIHRCEGDDVLSVPRQVEIKRKSRVS